MDHVLNIADRYVLTPHVYPASWPEDGALRQVLSLLLLTNVGAELLYVGFATFSFYYRQLQRELRLGVTAIFWMSFPTVALFFAEIRGYSKLYDDISESPSDMVIYWMHRVLHHKSVYKYLHKQHHVFKIPTPFASHAFHPLDGFLQSLPYHVYPFLFPLHKVVYLVLFVFVNVWTISIHDGDFRIPWPLIEVINGAAHHVDHHLYFYYNYGQYFTLWDRLGGSYRHPSVLRGQGPLDHVRKLTT
ncbi:hypothetical protein CRUP_038794 [Coryphaenoides rupestris]|nr:hypothetical protein CRUP_038794 [Coryphaenoides rupestris]